MRIAIVLGSTRPGRKGEAVARWVLEQVGGREDAEFELVDVAEYDLKLLDDPEIPGAANRQYQDAATRRWGEKIDGFDGFIWVTPEYNHGVPAALKNALDVLYPEWNGKAFGLVGYGADGGVRAVEHWRGIIANVLGVDVRAQLALYTFSDWDSDGVFTPTERRAKELGGVVDQLVAMTARLRG